MAEESVEAVVAQRERMMEGLRTFGGHFTEFSRVFARWLGLHATDANALLQIIAAEERGVPLSPARLSKSLPLSSGATTALLNRLEEAGHIIRTREHADRRIVTLRSSKYIHERADMFFRPLGERLDALISTYPPRMLRTFEAFVGELSKAMEEELDRDDRNR
ncbi:MarR family winged helix-turn-helix transcriptional regulator [Tomitella cavernea]|uniref:HTH marR-type domain-containing protein n=1 Tax=Tomitella cavernea TaxID=1387982 RepID=A0ABP9CZF8_9ACTN|nr:MarR family transcriptional regulator [Tomitella cavernea]